MFIIMLNNFILAPVASYLVNRFTHRQIVIVAGLVSTVGFFTSAFATNIYILCITYGVLVGMTTQRLPLNGLLMLIIAYL